jgi:SAM-dependent methyltransferase
LSPIVHEKQVLSRQRVADHGEVLTGAREVNAMLDLVKQETERIDSRFLEPACGDGNFLAEILRRKLRVVEARYRQSQLEYERNAVLAVSSLYGIDILADNVAACRKRLLEIFAQAYTRLFKGKTKPDCRAAVEFILSRNIIHGDALTLKTVGEKPEYIVFSEWSPVNGSLLKRRDFSFHRLLRHEETRQELLFPDLDKGNAEQLPLFSDLGEDVFIPTPEKEFPPTHFLEIARAQQC